MKLEYPRNLRFSCNRCGICCRDTLEKKRHVLLLCAEAEHIARFVGKRVCDFAERVEGREPYVYEMRNGHGGKCVFLVDNRCAVYELRPLVCRFYPFELASGEGEKFRFTATRECPCVSPGDGDELKEVFFRKLLRLAFKELGSAGEFAEGFR